MHSHQFLDPNFPRDVLYRIMLLEIAMAYAPDDVVKQLEILENTTQDLKDAWNEENGIDGPAE